MGYWVFRRVHARCGAVAWLYRDVGRRIGDIRRAKRLTQEQLAERAETSGPWIAKIEIGAGRPTLEMIQKIAVALGVPLWRLVTDNRLTPDEDEWKGEARALADAITTLKRDDLVLLTTLAKHLGMLRRDT